MQPKFQINQEVFTSKIGVPAKGKISGIYTGYAYSRITKGIEQRVWDKYYDNWRDFFVYTLHFNPGIKRYSLEEFMEQQREMNDILPIMTLTESKIKEVYEYQLPNEEWILYPELDLVSEI